MAVAGQSAPRALAASLRFLLGDAVNSPTVDEVDSVIFSRPPYSKEETSSIVYASAAAIYVLCVIILLVATNLDSGERRRRRARAIVPEESVPCAIAEQYYLDDHLVTLRSSPDFEARKERKGFCSYLVHYGRGLPDALARQHLFLSLFVKAIPTFTRVKRGFLIVVHLHLCMLTSALAFNVVEHEKPNGKYEMITCGGSLIQSDCTATLPLSLICGVAVYPIFRFVAVRQMRLTCFVSQLHSSSSIFPLNVRKFARIPPKSAWESLFCMRNSHERLQGQVLQSRTTMHRLVYMLWRTTQPSVKDLRFYGKFTSWCILLSMVVFSGLTGAYVIFFTAYLSGDAVYHWLAWTLTMFFSTIFLLEPLQILFVEVIWCAGVAAFAQRWSFGAHALAHTTRYKEVVRGIEQEFIKKLRAVAAARIQKWWLAVLDMYKVINEQTAVAVNFQAITPKTVLAKKYAKERKWCLKVEVLDCYELEEISDLMNPIVRLQCDVGNPNVLQTKVAWDAHKRASFKETFFVDIKESQAMYVSVWSKTPACDELVGRGYFDFNQLKGGSREKPEGQDVKVTLHDIEHGAKRTRMNRVRGYVNLRVKFLDPAQEPTGAGDGNDGAEETAWMLPKHRMQFALSKMGGRMKVSKMLGGLGAPMAAQVPMKSPSGPMQLETGKNWYVHNPNGNVALHSKLNGSGTGLSTPSGTAPVSPTGSLFKGVGSTPATPGPTHAPTPAATAVALDTQPQGPPGALPPPTEQPPPVSAMSLSPNSARAAGAAAGPSNGAQAPSPPGFVEGVEDDADGGGI